MTSQPNTNNRAASATPTGRRNIGGFLLAAFLTAASVAPASAGFLFWEWNKGEDPLASAKTLFREGRYSASAAQFQAALGTSLATKDKKLAYWFIGQCYERNGDYDRALTDYQIGTQLYPKDIPLLLSRGRLYQTTGLLEQARTMFLAIQKLDSGSFEANIGLAQVYAKEGFFRHAQQYYKTALESMQVRDASLWRQYAECVFAQRKYRLARTIIEQALSIDSGDAATLLLSARMYYDNGEKPAALDEITRASAIAPERNDIALRRALWLATGGETAKSLGISQAALVKNPNDPLALFAAALAYLKSGQTANATQCLQKASAIKDTPFIAAASRQMLKQMNNSAK